MLFSEVQNYRLQQRMINHDVVHIQLWIQLSPLFQLQELSIASIIMALTWAFHPSVRTLKTYYTWLPWESTAANSWTTSSPFRPLEWNQRRGDILLPDICEWTYFYLYLRLARLLLLQLAASGTLSKLITEHAHCLYIVEVVRSR